MAVFHHFVEDTGTYVLIILMVLMQLNCRLTQHTALKLNINSNIFLNQAVSLDGKYEELILLDDKFPKNLRKLEVAAIDVRERVIAWIENTEHRSNYSIFNNWWRLLSQIWDLQTCLENQQDMIRFWR